MKNDAKNPATLDMATTVPTPGKRCCFSSRQNSALLLASRPLPHRTWAVAVAGNSCPNPQETQNRRQSPPAAVPVPRRSESPEFVQCGHEALFQIRACGLQLLPFLFELDLPEQNDRDLHAVSHQAIDDRLEPGKLVTAQLLGFIEDQKRCRASPERASRARCTWVRLPAKSLAILGA